MRRLPPAAWLTLLVATALVAAFLLWTPPPAPGPESPPGAARPATVGEDVPQRVHDVLAEIERRGGRPPPGHVGGRVFQNRERRLPPGSYREYDVNPRVPGRSRDAERLVIEQRTGKAYYTSDHYETFTPVN
jgi:ribonuclease T1